MDDKKLSRFILIYFLLIPVMWFLTEAVWGGVYGALGGIKIGKALQDPNKLSEVTAFMKKHGLSESASKEERKSWVENLSREDKEEFQKIVMPSVRIKDIMTFGSALAACSIVFGLIGLISGALTKTWVFVGFFPAISFLLNNPVVRFRAILNLSDAQKIALVFGQFLACYIFAFTGAFLCNVMKKRRQQKKARLNDPVEIDRE